MKKLALFLGIFVGMLCYLFFNQMSITQERVIMKLESFAFKNGDVLPKKYTCEGEDINPSLQWQQAPKNTQSFVLIVDDPDAPATKPDSWVHWIVFNIPSTVMNLDENVAVATLKGAKQGITNSGKSKFHGACPPFGDGVHHYHFTLYALDTTLDLPEGVSKNELLTAMKNHILAEAVLMATYER